MHLIFNVAVYITETIALLGVCIIWSDVSYSTETRKVLSRVVLITALLILTGLLTGSLVVGTYTYLHGNKEKEVHLGMGGDIVVAGELNFLWQSTAHVTECLQQGDYRHHPSAYYLPRADLGPLPEEDIPYTANGHVNNSVPVVLPGNEDYLLWNSRITLDICLTHPNASGSSAQYSIVNNDDSKTVCKGKLPVFDAKLNCTSRSKTECPISHPGYYTTRLNLATGTTYDASVHLTKVYVNYSRIENYMECNDISDKENPCKLVGPKFKHTEYIIMVNITHYPPYVEVPPTTHVCVTYDQSLFYVFFFVLSVVFLILFCMCCVLNIWRGLYGYFHIKCTDYQAL